MVGQMSYQAAQVEGYLYEERDETIEDDAKIDC